MKKRITTKWLKEISVDEEKATKEFLEDPVSYHRRLRDKLELQQEVRETVDAFANQLAKTLVSRIEYEVSRIHSKKPEGSAISIGR